MVRGKILMISSLPKVSIVSSSTVFDPTLAFSSALMSKYSPINATAAMSAITSATICTGLFLLPWFDPWFDALVLVLAWLSFSIDTSLFIPS
jgi:hypothetical protein